jgi:hypothetical protein
MKMKEDLVRITYETHQKRLTAEEKAAREGLKATIEQAIERFQAKFPKTDVIEIEVHPCDCAVCAAA